MAVDYYLQLGDIKGESQDSTHSGCIECLTVSWKIIQPKSATASTAGGHTAERAELSEIHIVKLIDVSSPVLAQYCAAGKTIPKAKIEFYRADGSKAERVKFFELELENVLISHIAPSFAGGVSFPTESLGLRYSQVRYKYTQQGIKGGAMGNTTGGWNLSTNRIA